MQSLLQVTYHCRSDAHSIDARAHSIAVEQSVEMPVTAIDDAFVLDRILGRVVRVSELSPDWFEIRIDLAAETAGRDPGQLINILFGNTSIHADVVLYDVEFPADYVATFGGPRHGLQGLRQRVGAGRRALTCAALKPQGLTPARLADIARKFADAGIDYIKDDHGLADQSYSPFAERVVAVTGALRGKAAHYVPSLSGDLDSMRQQIAIAVQAGVHTVMLAPLIAGLSNVYRLVVEHAGIAFIAHPSLAGASRIAPPLLLGKLFRMIGADAIIFPNYGGRFGYSRETCHRLAAAALVHLAGLRPAVPVPAGGMTRERVAEMLEFYGADVMLLIGGALLAAGDRLVEETSAFVGDVRDNAQR